MFSALSEGTADLKDKINLFVAICPITNMGRSRVEFFPDSEKKYKKLANLMGTLN